MTLIILSFLLFVGAWADPQLPVPEKTLQDYSKVKGINDSDNGSTPIALPDQQILQGHQEHRVNGDIAKNLSVKNRAPVVYGEVDTDCYHPFETVSGECLYFSSITLSFSGAVDYCKSLSVGHISDINLVMLEFDDQEDIALMGAVAAKDNTYWVGGKTEDGLSWNYLDDRSMNLNAPFWYQDEPNDSANRCVSTQVTSVGNFKRANFFDTECSESLNFICQTGCPTNFKRIGRDCYFQSFELNVPNLSWDDSRDYCQALAVPMGYYSDLAVLGRPGQETYTVMHNLSATTQILWLGAYDNGNCEFVWIDGRSFEDWTFYWRYNYPLSCGEDQVVGLYYESSYKTKRLANYPRVYLRPFACQMFKDQQY